MKIVNWKLVTADREKGEMKINNRGQRESKERNKK